MDLCNKNYNSIDTSSQRSSTTVMAEKSVDKESEDEDDNENTGEDSIISYVIFL